MLAAHDRQIAPGSAAGVLDVQFHDGRARLLERTGDDTGLGIECKALRQMLGGKAERLFARGRNEKQKRPAWRAADDSRAVNGRLRRLFLDDGECGLGLIALGRPGGREETSGVMGTGSLESYLGRPGGREETSGQQGNNGKGASEVGQHGGFLGKGAFGQRNRPGRDYYNMPPGNERDRRGKDAWPHFAGGLELSRM